MSSASTPAAAFVAGRYLLRERIGAGAAGEIWSAVDPRIGRPVAIKFRRIPDGLSQPHREEWEGRFLLEARAAGRLSHPGIVSVYDVGTASDGRPFIVMELVLGQSLDVVRQSGPRPPLSQIVDWTIEVAQALDAAHRCGVIHRDVKPANILIGTDGRARIADFGIARVAESELTRDGTFVGSPAFAAPEQLCGATVDGRADVFALAAVFYLLTTGTRPFEGDDIPAIVYAVCHLEPSPPGLSPSIDAVVMKALAKSPDDRFAGAAEFGEALRSAVFPAGAALPVDVAEARAVTIASAGAVALLRAWRATACAAKRLAALTAETSRRDGPRVRAALSRFASGAVGKVRVATEQFQKSGALDEAHASDVHAELDANLSSLSGLREESPRTSYNLAATVGRKWQVVGLVLFVACSLLAIYAYGGRNSRVDLVIDGAVEGGTIEVREGETLLLREKLDGPAQASFRLPPGRHELALAVVAPGRLNLGKAIDVEVEPRTAYELQVSVSTWPWKRIGTDWDRVSD